MYKSYKNKIINKTKLCVILLILLTNLGSLIQFALFEAGHSQDYGNIPENDFDYNDNSFNVKISNSIELRNDLNITWGYAPSNQYNGIINNGSDSYFLFGYKVAPNWVESNAIIEKYNNSMDLVWAFEWDTGRLDECFAAAIDSFNNLYVTGRTNGLGNGYYDIFLLKINKYGEYQLNVTWGGTSNEEPRAIAIDSFDNIYITGFTDSYGAGYDDIFLLKYNVNGTLIWDEIWGTSWYDKGLDLTIDSSDDIILSGGYGEGNTDVYTAKLNSTGDIVWDNVWGPNSSESGISVALDSNDDVFVVSSYLNDFIIIKYNSTGSEKTNWQWGTDQNDGPYEIKIDDFDNIYVLGQNITPSPRYMNNLLVKFNSSGYEEWNYTWGGHYNYMPSDLAIDDNNDIHTIGFTTTYGSNSDSFFWTVFNGQGGIIRDYITWGGGYERGYDVKTDSQNNVYVTGDTNSFGNGSNDIILIKYDSSGNHIWNRSWGSTHFDSGRSITFDSINNILVGGITFNNTKGEYDVVILKFDPDGNLISELIWGDQLSDYCGNIILDSNENLYFVGSTENFGAVQRDVLLVKFNSSWEYQWNITFGTDGYDDGEGIEIDSFDNIYICGDTDGVPPRKFVNKYNSSGDEQWSYITGGVGSSGTFYDIVLDENNNTYACGYHYSLGDYDAILTKIDNNGQYVWSRTWQVNPFDDDEYAHGVALDSSNNIYIAGYVFTGPYAIFMAKYNTSGDLVLNKIWNGSRIDSCRGLDIDNQDQIYLAGYTDSIGEGEYDLLLVRYSYIDEIPPSVTINAPKENSLHGNTTISYELTIDEDNLDTIWYNFNDGMNYTTQNTAGTIEQDAWDNVLDPTATLTFYANDTYGNLGSSQVLIFKDSQRPILILHNPGNNTYYSSDPPTYNITIIDTHSNQSWYTMNGGQKIFFDTNGTLQSEEWNNQAEGPVLLKFYANDSVSNIGYLEITITKDTIKPNVTIIQPSGGLQYNNTAPNFVVKINDTNLDTMWYSLNNGINQIFSYNTTFNQDLWENLEDGLVSIEFFANDSAGNIGNDSIMVYVDVHGPQIFVNMPSNYTVFEFPPEFNINLFDINNVSKSWYIINSGTKKYFFSTNSTIKDTAWNSTLDGNIYIDFYANDTFGNINFNTIILIKDTTEPEINIISPTSGESIGRSAPSFQVEINDLTLHNTWYSLDGGITNVPFFGTSGTINKDLWESLWDSLDYGDPITITFYANDTLGHLSSNQVEIIKSRPSPDSTIPGFGVVLTIGIIILSIIMLMRLQPLKQKDKLSLRPEGSWK